MPATAAARRATRNMEALRENENVLAASEKEVQARHAERVRLLASLSEAGYTQQSLVDAINDSRETMGVKPLTVDAVQKAIKRARES